MFHHATIEHMRAFLWGFMLIGAALVCLSAKYAHVLFPASVQAMSERMERETIREARALFAAADALDRDARAVASYFARYSAVRVPSSVPRARALRMQGWALLAGIVATGIVDQIGGA